MGVEGARVGSVFYQTADTPLAVALFAAGLGLDPVTPVDDAADQEWVEFDGPVPIFVQRVSAPSPDDAAFGIQVPDVGAAGARLRQLGTFEVSEVFEISPGASALHVSGPGLQRLLVHE